MSNTTGYPTGYTISVYLDLKCPYLNLSNRSLEHEILSAPGHARALDALQVSPYRITQVVDSDGVIHSIREVC